jgi:hypothetical protein
LKKSVDTMGIGIRHGSAEEILLYYYNTITTKLHRFTGPRWPISNLKVNKVFS